MDEKKKKNKFLLYCLFSLQLTQAVRSLTSAPPTVLHPALSIPNASTDLSTLQELWRSALNTFYKQKSCYNTAVVDVNATDWVHNSSHCNKLQQVSELIQLLLSQCQQLRKLQFIGILMLSTTLKYHLNCTQQSRIDKMRYLLKKEREKSLRCIICRCTTVSHPHMMLL